MAEADLDRLIQVGLRRFAEGLDVDGLAIQGDDHVAGLEAGRLGRAIGCDVRDLDRRIGRDAGDAHHVDHAERGDGQQEVHAATRCEHDGADSTRLAGEAAGRGRILFAEHLDEGAEGDPVDRVHDAVAFEAPQAWWQTKAEFEHGDARQPSRDEVSQLVNEHHDAQDGEEPEDIHSVGPCAGIISNQRRGQNY